MSKAAVMEAVSQVGRGPYRDGSSLTPGTTYQPLPLWVGPGPPCHKPYITAEYAAVRAHMGSPQGLVIHDIGANVGYYAIRLAAEGARVVAYEADPANRAVLSGLAEMHDPKGERVTVRAEVGLGAITKPVDVVLMLNVHMWLVKQGGREFADALLREIAETGAGLYFQTAKQAAGKEYPWLDGADKQADYLSECGFQRVEKLRTTGAHGGVRHMFFAVADLESFDYAC